MTIGDQSDFRARLRAYLPAGWFADSAPILDGVLAGYATAAAFLYGAVAYAKAQTRIATAGDGFLDLIAGDFLGQRLTRATGQGDAAFRRRILPEILRPRASRPAMVTALTDLTGRAPSIMEPGRPADCGGYDGGGAGYDIAVIAGGGGWGDPSLTAQSFVVAYRPVGAGVANAAGLDSGAGGYDSGGLEYTSADMVAGGVTDAQIFAAIDQTKPAGSLVWARIQS